jgi:hypothetical protein
MKGLDRKKKYNDRETLPKAERLETHASNEEAIRKRRVIKKNEIKRKKKERKGKVINSS